MRLEECRSALVHHWFFTMAGGERVCEAVCEILEKPDLFAIVADPGSLSETLKRSTLTTSFVQQVPGARKWYRYYTWMFPLAVELFDMSGYDLVISSDANTVKGVVTNPETCHVCYCHSPMRYAWNLFHDYRRVPNPLKSAIISLTMHYLRLWDYCAAGRVDYFVANSQTVKRRIATYYRRDSKVIYPPCDVERFSISPEIDDYYLLVGRLVDYKKADLAVRAFGRSGRRLLVVGRGPQLKNLQAIAGPNVEFLDRVDDRQLADLYSRCKALIFPGEEDFGIVPVEAQAAGRPVIAYGKGGALETVASGKTGLFFLEQTVEALNAAVEQFERDVGAFDPAAIRRHAERFGKDRFQREIREHLEWCLNDHAERLEG
jgi:glycosyltransferase involved in cell wall biosynthesis